VTGPTPPVAPPPSPAPRVRPHQPPEPARARWRSRARRVLPYVVIGGAGFLAAYLVVYLFVFPTRLVPNDRPVPAVVGMLQSDADRTLRDAGFTPQVAERRVNASVPAETVLQQNPVASSMKPRGTDVLLYIATSP
jgi:hypothetical protein